MALVTSRAVVLQTYRYSDTSKVLRLMTREHGPRSVIAKGALRPGSRFGGVLEPFAEGEATLYVREGRDLHTLSGFELVRERQALGADLVRFSGGSVMCELVMRLAPEHRDDRLFGTLVEGLDALVEASPGDVAAVALHRIWRVVSVLGFAPDLRRCLECDRQIPDGEGARFDHAAGGLRCHRCSPHGYSLNALGLRRLRRLSLGGLRESVAREDGPGDRNLPAGERAAPQTGGGVSRGGIAGGNSTGRAPEGGSSGRATEQARILTDFIRYHMAEETRLRSLDILLGL